MSYGTGAIMAVPAHDDRDWDFAKKFNLPIIEVVKGGNVQEAAFTDCATGIMVNSGFLDGMTVEEAKKAITEFLTEKGVGHAKVNYKLRDWVFSRQRYWGEPIPLVKCEKCGWVPIPESELPLELPNVDSYEPTDDGESPLAPMTDWVNTTCPCCGGPAKRETDTMPQWAGSSWYFLRYMDPHNNDALASKEALEYWGPVDWYNGGMEHTTLHLLYSRFWHKFLYDIGVVPYKEPYQKRTSHGMILGLNPHSFENQDEKTKKDLIAQYGDEKGAKQYLRDKFGEMADHPVVKMSKSLGNVVNPDDTIDEYGADTMRLYEMFIGDFEKSAAWSQKAIKGCRRFIERVWQLFDKVQPGDTYSKENEVAMHRTIQKVTEDIEGLKMNTAIAQMMTLLNQLADKGVNRAEYKTLLTLLNPFAPHVTEELWQMLGETDLLSLHTWPEYDEKKTVEASIQIAVQVNGKVKGKVTLPMDCPKEEALSIAMADSKVQNAIAGKNVVKSIVVPNKIINLVVK